MNEYPLDLPELKLASDALDALIRKLHAGVVSSEEVDQGHLLVKACDSRRGNVNTALKVQLARPELARIIEEIKGTKPRVMIASDTEWNGSAENKTKA